MDKIIVNHYDNSAEIVIKGNLNIHNTENLLREFNIMTTDGTPYSVIGINCQDLDSIDSSGLGALISMSKKADGINAEFYVFNINKKVSTLFDISHLSQYFQVISAEEFRQIVQT